MTTAENDHQSNAEDTLLPDVVPADSVGLLEVGVSRKDKEPPLESNIDAVTIPPLIEDDNATSANDGDHQRTLEDETTESTDSTNFLDTSHAEKFVLSKPMEPEKMQSNSDSKVAGRRAVPFGVGTSTPPKLNRSSSTSSNTPNTNAAQSKSAQVLLNRFSSWRKMANENAQALLEKTKKSSTPWTLGTNRRSFSDRTMPRSVIESQTVEQSNERDESDAENLQSVSQVTTSGSASSTDDDDELQQQQPSGTLATPLPSVVPPLISSERPAKVSIEPLEQRMAGAAVAVKVAASAVADSVATGFRGRYSGRAVVDAINPRKTKRTPPPPLIESQTALILKSRAASHMQSILENLDSHEYVMLLGPGMFGVNLKQTYLKNHGTYVDYLVQGGAAEKSGVVYVGDLLVKVGEVDVRKGTILTVPRAIAAAKRPVILVLSTGTKVTLERINYVDVAVAMMHRIRHGTAEDTPTGSRHSNDGDQGESIDDDEEEAAKNQEEMERKETDMNSSSSPENSDIANDSDEKKDVEAIEWNTSVKCESPFQSMVMSIPSVISPPIPAETSVESFINPPIPPLDVRESFAPDIAKRCNETFSAFLVRQAMASDANVRACLQNAFLTCVLDGRKYPFLSRHLSSGREGIESEEEESTLAAAPGSALLMLFLEMMSFVDLYGVTPPARRREIARRIAYKFFLPSKVGDNLEGPVFDFHHIVPDSSLRRLENTLASSNPESIPRDVFLDFQQAVLSSLSGSAFLSFLMSHECARMRAYLRNTAPFVNVPLHDVYGAVVSATTTDSNSWASTAKNHFSYMLVHLLCQSDKDTTGEMDESSSDVGPRTMEAASGLCCAVFIRRDLTDVINKAKLTISSTTATSDAEVKVVLLSVVDAFRRIWNTFLVPTSGGLANSPYSNETEDAMASMRSLVRDALSGLISKELTEDHVLEVAKRLVEPNLISEANRLADELLYDYAVNSHSRYRDHKFHEWMCGELCKSLNMIDSSSNGQLLLPPGCIKRLLRRVELPPGVSSHKPARVAPPNLSKRCYPNADYAVVFGTGVGTDLVSQTPNPGLDNTEIRRFACQSVALDKAQQHSDDFDVAQVPATLESYVVFPPAAVKPFARYRHDIQLSTDGWEVSLVNFLIPNAESSSENNMDSSLFGVSLVFQKYGDFSGGGKSLVARSGTTTTEPSIEESSHLPIFNRRLRGQPWSERAIAQNSMNSSPLVIGIALVGSRQNVIPAMRDTLSRLFADHCQNNTVEGNDDSFSCTALVDILGNFVHQDVESFALRSILEPHLQLASKPWLERPISDQKDTFEAVAGQQLMSSLGPIPLALLFVTVLLEQKVVISSSRRSMLLYSTTALSRLIEPLKWCHLLVPLVPSALGRDLMQYPAPYIIGLPSEDQGNMEILNNLPDDVTLVDLDVGRVILAPAFSHDMEALRGDDNVKVTSRALRSQILYLAQALGGVIGADSYKQAWRCDSPSSSLSPDTEIVDKGSFDSAKNVCFKFLCELLEGTSACCYWIEEARASSDDHSERDPSVLFDEDRFLHIKNIRAQQRNETVFQLSTGADRNLALSLDDFDLFLESFLRCQSMSSFVSSLPQRDMVYY